MISEISSRLLQNPPSIDSQIEYKSSISIILALENHCMYLLVMKRTINDLDPWSGHFSFPGGGLKAGETFYEACIRETKEEVGINLSNTTFAGYCEDYISFYKSGLVVRPHVFVTNERHETINCNFEVDATYWLPVASLINPKHHQEKQFKTFTGPQLLPYVEVGNILLWGITFKVLISLLRKLDGLYCAEGLPCRLPARFIS